MDQFASLSGPGADAPNQGESGHVVAITGGSSGIGMATARLFARRGWRVGLIARGQAGLETAAGHLRAGGAMVATAQADVSKLDELGRAADAIIDSLGPIDVWINDAGISFFARLQDMGEVEFRRVMDVTFMGQVHGTRVALARMAARGRGTIVHVGSVAAFRGFPLQSAYCAAKFALRGFVESVRAELMHDGVPIALSLVHPPSVNTPFFSHAGSRMPPGHEDEHPRPVPPVYAPELIAEAIWLAATEQRRELKVSGSAVNFAWLNRLLPGGFDRLAAGFGIARQRTGRPDVAGLRAPALFEPADHGGTIHGPWSREARQTSGQMWLERNRTAVGMAAVALLVVMRAARPARRLSRQRR